MAAIKENKRFAVYSRKSKFTGKGESIENQIELCKQYINLHYSNVTEENIVIFEDEGFSGKSFNRPQFKQMMHEIRQEKFSAIVCYKLDRISRNIADFASLINELEALGVAFLSVRDRFDTSSPGGKAMMYMVSVFSQFERETIAERIRDNMHELAKSGRWLGGNAPTGYRSKIIQKVMVDDKKRSAYKLDVIPEEAELVQQIYQKFISFNSLTKTETYLLQNGMTTKNGKNFTRFSIKAILQNPVYMIADNDAWNYYDKLGVDVYADKFDFNGKHGIMAYNKTIQKTGKANEIRDISEWIIAVGKHEGIVQGADWIKVQRLLDQNRSKSYRKPKSNTALLSGLLICGNCGSYMRPKMYNNNASEDSEKRFSYLCETKEKSRMQLCDIKNPNGNILDKAVCVEIKKLSSNHSEFIMQLENIKKSVIGNTEEYDKQIDSLKANVTENERNIKVLVSSLAKTEGTASHKYITEQINELHEKNEAIKDRIEELEDLMNTNELSDMQMDLIKDMLVPFAGAFDTMGIEQKRTALRTFINKIIWDGENVHIYLFGANEDKENGNAIPAKIPEPKPKREDSK